MYDIPLDKTIQNVVTLQAHTSAYVDTEKEKKLVFLTRLLELLSQKQFSMNDYYFAFQSYPKCNYEQLRDFLVLPSKRKLQYITSSIDKDQVLRETFDKVQTMQHKDVFLLVDEVQIRPTVSFSGGLLSGMAENNRDCKATSILITRRQGTVRVKERQYSDDYYTHTICCQPLKFAVNPSEKDKQKNAVLQTSVKKARVGCTWCTSAPGVPVHLVYPCTWCTRAPGVPVHLVYPCTWCTRAPGVPVHLVYPCTWCTRAPGVTVLLVRPSANLMYIYKLKKTHRKTTQEHSVVTSHNNNDKSVTWTQHGAAFYKNRQIPSQVVGNLIHAGLSAGRGVEG
ncbi:hypothetical protein FHG87_000215 [Trinorchestia longiramus]|nr:hypothetical protein FHG87_000215 [Trinorchestia longiramus]